MPTHLHADVCLIGVGFGGYAALLALLERGLRVAAFEEYEWIGGQVTSQALCVLDEFHDPVAEGIGASRRYEAFREALRQHYKKHFRLSEAGRDQLYFNPGNAMNSFMVAEPQVAHRVLRETLAPYVASGQLQLFCGWIAESARCDNEGRRVCSVTCKSLQNPAKRIETTAAFFLDGTEAGDLYPVLPVPFRIGIDGRAAFDEPDGESFSDPLAIQSSTACFAMEFIPGGDHRIAKPADYEYWKNKYAFALNAPGATPDEPSFMFRRRIGKNGRMIPPAFYYRSVIDHRNFSDPDRCHSRTIMNAGCHDFKDEPMVGGPRPTHEVFQQARALSLAYFYWLQNEAPRDASDSDNPATGARHGYPELRLCPELTGTPEGIAMAPYIREGRRICASTTIVEQDIAIASNSGARARHFDDSIGLGGFVIDIHQRCTTKKTFHGGVRTRPYQIPLHSLVSPALDNFAVAGKCIGTTQITNGAYRLHNIEWAIGESAGELAAFCIRQAEPHPRLTGRALLDYQRELVGRGVPVFWYDDLPATHPAFTAIQLLSARRIWPASARHLRADAQHSVARSLRAMEIFFRNLRSLGVELGDLPEIALIGHGTRKADVLHRVWRLLETQGWPARLWSSDWQPETLPPDASGDDIPGPLE